MKPSHYFASLLWVASVVNAVSIPESHALALANPEVNDQFARDIVSPDHALEKRKGGGGKGGGGGGGGGKSGSGSGSGAKSGGGSSGSGSRSGSGVRPSYGGGSYYGGGAKTPYRAGSGSPKGLFAGALLLPAAALLLFPGIWLYNVYPYHYRNNYTFYNRSAQNSNTKRDGANQTLGVTCLCQEFSACGCDDNDDTKFFDELVGNGSYAALNRTLVNVHDETNGTRTLVINGTLPNDTIEDDGSSTAASASLGRAQYLSGYGVMAAIVISAVALL